MYTFTFDILRTALLFAVIGYASNSFSASCTGTALVDQTFITNSSWKLCWELRDQEGVVLKEVSYETPGGISRNVLKEAALAGINIAYDDGSPSQRPAQLTNGGGLGINTQTLTQSDCQGGTLHYDGSNAILCAKIVRRGYIYKAYTNVKQGYALVLESRVSIGAHSYIIRWKLYDDGTIEPKVGLAGRLSIIGNNQNYGWELDNNNRIGVSFNTSYFFKLDFDLAADGSNELIEEFEVTPSASRLQKSLSVSTLTSETSRSLSADLKRSWRIRDAASGVSNSDGRPISYHIEPLHHAHQYTGKSAENWLQNDIHFTQYDSCERLFIDNPTAGGCGSNITDFINGESIQNQDIVIWYKLNYHHLPRSEDEPEIQIHWDSFFIVPRDWTATNPLSSVLIDLSFSGGLS